MELLKVVGRLLLLHGADKVVGRLLLLHGTDKVVGRLLLLLHGADRVVRRLLQGCYKVACDTMLHACHIVVTTLKFLYGEVCGFDGKLSQYISYSEHPTSIQVSTSIYKYLLHHVFLKWFAKN